MGKVTNYKDIHSGNNVIIKVVLTLYWFITVWGFSMTTIFPKAESSSGKSRISRVKVSRIMASPLASVVTFGSKYTICEPHWITRSDDAGTHLCQFRGHS